MTTVLSVHSRDWIWVLVDRRLSYGPHRTATDTAVKVVSLDTTDAVAVLAYAGLGATPGGTEPSAWMSAVLRGRGGLTLEQALGVLAGVATKELPRHLARVRAGPTSISAHHVVIPAFVKGDGARLYAIDNVLDQKARKHWYRYTRVQRTSEPGSAPPRLGFAGTGGIYLAREPRRWQRHLLRLVNAHDRDKVSSHLVADQLAAINYEAHQKVRDGTVGPRSIVVWRPRGDARSAVRGGGHQFYTRTERDNDLAAIPTIANGMDVGALVGMFMAEMQKRASGIGPGLLDFDTDEMNQRLAELPSEPDEKLR